MIDNNTNALTEHQQGETNPEQKCIVKKDDHGLFALFLISFVFPTIMAGMILDGGEVCIPALIGSAIASTVIFIIIMIRRGNSRATKYDRIIIASAATIIFMLYLLILPYVWHLRGII